MFAEVVRWVRIQRTQIYTNGKYLVDSHILTVMRRFHDMQLVVVVLGQERAELRDPNMMKAICNSSS